MLLPYGGNHVHEIRFKSLCSNTATPLKQSDFINPYCYNIYISLYRYPKLVPIFFMAYCAIHRVSRIKSLRECSEHAEIAHVKSVLNVHDEMSK